MPVPESAAPNPLSRLHVGTSGWSYPDWKVAFYPREVPRRLYLEHYTTRFPATELNASFYRLPSEKTIEGWRERTPPGFRFCVKLSRFVTHRKRLGDPDDSLELFLDRFRPLRRRMGPVLAQLPPSLAFDSRVAAGFLRSWRRRTRLSLALEARHESWMGEEALALLRDFNVALVRADSGGKWPLFDIVTADFVYLRYHGPGRLYASGYSPQKLAADAARIAKWLAEERNLWAFFNNTDGGHAWRDATRLRRLVAKRMRGPATGGV